MPRNYDVTKPGDVRRFVRDVQKTLQKEFDREAKRNPLKLSISPDVAPAQASGVLQGGAQVVQNFNAPVVIGDGSQVQFASHVKGNVEQHQVKEVASGFENVAKLLDNLLQALPAIGLPDDENKSVVEEAEVVLEEVTAEVLRPAIW